MVEVANEPDLAESADLGCVDVQWPRKRCASRVKHHRPTGAVAGAAEWNVDPNVVVVVAVPVTDQRRLADPTDPVLVDVKPATEGVGARVCFDGPASVDGAIRNVYADVVSAVTVEVADDGRLTIAPDVELVHVKRIVESATSVI